MTEKMTAEIVKSILKTRDRDSAKWDYGSVLLMAGSPGMAGAAVLCGKGALRAGAGLTRYAAPPELIPILQTAVPDIMCRERGAISPSDGYDCAAIGPGLGDHREDAQIIYRFLHEYDGRIVLDADGINDIVRYGMQEDLRSSCADIIVTPHMGEAARLLGIKRAEDREKCAVGIAEMYGVTAVVKGPGTITASPDGRVRMNTTGNPGMAAGGTGDVLTGITAALFVQGYSAFDAASSAVFIHGMAGDRCAARLGEAGMCASDLPVEAALALKYIIESEKE